MADDDILFELTTPSEFCSGPNHGQKHVLPPGNRYWRQGIVLSLDQVTDTGATHNLFCSPDCLCDWHGAHAALFADQPPDGQIPGVFRFIWVARDSSSVWFYDTWDDFTERIGEYQRAVLDLGGYGGEGE